MFIIESMVDKSRLKGVCHKFGFQNGLCVSSQGNSSGIGLWWRDQKVSLNSFSQRHNSITVEDEWRNCKWCTHGIYGWPEKTNKHMTWDLMKSLSDNFNLPSIFFGDFNEILRGDEKEGGVPRCDKDMDNFRRCIDDCNVVDLGYRGSCFTWCRGKKPNYFCS